MSFFEKLVAGVEMARRLDAHHCVKMAIGKVQFGRVHHLESTARCQRARIRNLRLGNVDAGYPFGRVSLRQTPGGSPKSESHIQNPARFAADANNHLIDKRVAGLPLRPRPCGPISEIEMAAVLVVATLIAAAHHAVIGAGAHRPTYRHHASPRSPIGLCAIVAWGEQVVRNDRISRGKSYFVDGSTPRLIR